METKHTPITDKLCSDPAIEKRDVPSRVWRVMGEFESDRNDLVAALRDVTDRLEAVCMDADGVTSNADLKRIAKARAAIDKAT